VTTAGGSGVNSNDILAAIQHPDPSTGFPTSGQEDTYLANALGQTVQSTDRNGNVHQYSYDVLGRLTSDNVTTLGAGVDGTVRQITYAYDSQGNNYLITSLDANSNIVNQVQRIFNGLGQLTGEYQSHSGAVVQGSTPEVQYAYTEMSGGQNNSRLTSITYPSGYVLNFNYNTGLDSNISRLSSISDSGGTLESYLYLGLDTVVERDHPQNNVNLTYISQNGQTGDAGDQYVGLDRFGRVVDQNWYNTTTQTSTDNFQYGYDQDSNVLYKQNLVDAVMSELYQYDNLNQLISFQRGTLNSTKNGISGTPSRSQSWTPDALGNFTGVTTNGTTQTRTANQQNEYTSISGSGTITYDANGNITADGSGNTYVYDAWNRLAAVKNGSMTLASYSYDGLDRRITETHGSTTTDLYYSANWQVLEERNNGQLQARYVWSPAGVDMLVLRDDSSQKNGVLDRRLYVQQDMLGNVTALVDTSGNVVERYDYDPFGAMTILNPDFSTRGTSGYNWNYFFQGQRYDGTVGLYDSRGRVYSPTLMRPLQADPLGFAAGDSNLYRYVGNNPTNATDPSGLANPMQGLGITDPEYRLVVDFLEGRIPISQVPARVRQIAENYYRTIIRSPHFRDINNARALNLARAQALRTGMNPPGNIHQFNTTLRLARLATLRVACGAGLLGGAIIVTAAINEGRIESNRKTLGIPPGSQLIREDNHLNGVQQTWRTPDGRIIRKTVRRGHLWK
jgi:RHS repeat-associated protein